MLNSLSSESHVSSFVRRFAMMKNADYTQHPELYAHTNWGQLDVLSTDKLDERIVNNRNAFVMDTQIQKIQRQEKWPNYISSEYLDLGLTRRGELYINANGQYIFLVSFPDLSPEKKALLDSLGFIHVYPMYEKG